MDSVWFTNIGHMGGGEEGEEEEMFISSTSPSKSG